MTSSLPERSLIDWITSLALCGVGLVVICYESVRALPGASLWDFGSFVASARAAREGLNPYGIYPLTFYVKLPGFEAWNPNLNPPISALLFQLFDFAEPSLSFRVWWAFSILCYLLVVALLVFRYAAGWRAMVIGIWALALAGFWDTLLLGQIYVPLALAGAIAWLLIEAGRGGHLAGVMIGLLASMKPNFLVWPVLLLLSGHYRTSAAALATFAAISVIPVLVFGPAIYQQWFELIASDSARASFLTNASLAGIAARAGSPGAGLVLSAAVLGAAALWALKRRPNPIHASAAGLVLGVFASPLGWIHYTLFLLPVLVRGWSSLPLRVVAAVFLIPVPFFIGLFGSSTLVQLTVGSAYSWAVALCAAAVFLTRSFDQPAEHNAALPLRGSVG